MRKEDINKSDKLFMPKMSKNLRSLNENVSFDKLGRVLVEGNVFYLRGKRTEITLEGGNADGGCNNTSCTDPNSGCHNTGCSG